MRIRHKLLAGLLAVSVGATLLSTGVAKAEFAPLPPVDKSIKGDMELVQKAVDNGESVTVVRINHEPIVTTSKDEYDKQFEAAKAKANDNLSESAKARGDGVFSYAPPTKETPAEVYSQEHVKDVQALFKDPEVLAVQPVMTLDAQDSTARALHNQLGVSDGSGVITAVVDSGLYAAHSNVTPAGEDCFDTVTNTCSGNTSSAHGTGTATNTYCLTANTGGTMAGGCDHGEGVAQVAVGQTNTSPYIRGMASSSTLWFIRAGFISHDTNPSHPDCGKDYCVRFSSNDLITAWNYVASGQVGNWFGQPIAAVNTSVGGGAYAGNCDSTFTGYAASINALKATGVSSAIAAGNDGDTNAMHAPGCIANALSVTAFTDGATNGIATYSNISATTDVMALGNINVDKEGDGTYEVFAGTSAATPNVAGALADLLEQYPSSTVDQRETALKTSGTIVTDNRSGCTCYGVHLFNLEQAYNTLATNLASGATKVHLYKGPVRILDTRIGMGTQNVAPLCACTYPFNIVSLFGLDPSKAKSLLLNITALNASTTSYISVGPGNIGSSPSWSNLNTDSSMPPRAFNVWTPTDGSGVVSIRNDAGTVDLIIDVLGYVGSSADTGIVTPSRIMDTRTGTGGVPAATVGAGATVTFDPHSKGGVPASNVKAVLANITVLAGTASTFVTAYPSAGSLPSGVHHVNVAGNAIRSNMAVIPIDSGGMKLYNYAGNSHILVDVFGYITTSGTTITVPTTVNVNTSSTFTTQLFLLQDHDFATCGTGMGGVVANYTLVGGVNGAYTTWYQYNSDQPASSTVNANNGEVSSNLSETGMIYNGTNDPQVAGYMYSPTTGSWYLLDLQACIAA